MGSWPALRGTLPDIQREASTLKALHWRRGHGGGDALARGERIEIRGFGSFSLHYRAPRIGRNPKTGEQVALAGKYVPHFKPGKELRERVNEGLLSEASLPESADDNLGAA